MVDEVLQITHPSRRSREPQIAGRDAECAGAAERGRPDSAAEKNQSLQAKAEELTGDNKDCKTGVNTGLPAWARPAVSLGIVAILCSA